MRADAVSMNFNSRLVLVTFGTPVSAKILFCFALSKCIVNTRYLLSPNVRTTFSRAATGYYHLQSMNSMSLHLLSVKSAKTLNIHMDESTMNRLF